MGLRKFTGTDGKPEVLAPKEQKAVQAGLAKVGKKSAADLSDEERRKALDSQ